MHILGKIFAFLVVVAAICAAIFTSKLVAVRNSWTAKVLVSKEKAAKTAEEIAKLESKIDSLKAELFRSQDFWGASWNGVKTDISEPEAGTLLVNIGASSGVRQDLVMHGFEIGADGSSIYRGSFSPIEVRNDSASLKPNWRATADDISTWQNGNWRWRNALPPGHQENFDRQALSLVKDIETLGDRRRTLEGQKQLLEEANNGLKIREAELVGGESLSNAESVEPEFRKGLVAAVEQAEEERNLELEKVDELRRKVRIVQAEIERLQADNTALTQKLPGPSSRDTVTQKQ